MAYNETTAAAEVLGREITQTRAFFDRIGELVAPVLRKLTARTEFGAADAEAAKNVMDDIYYPNEGAARL